jgi:hypothetical protein
MMGRLLPAGVLVALLSACVPAPALPTAPTGFAWQQVELAGVRPASLAVAGGGLLVGGRTADAPAPRLLRLTGGSVAGELRLEPADPNAAAADLVRLTVAGDDVYAIGTMIAGAHSNPRLTVWDGTLGSAVLSSHTQEFFTFGGHDAGPLLGTVAVDGGPVIFGSRVGERGPYGLLWTRRGHTWSQQASRAALASTPDREYGFSALARSGDRLVVSGDELGLAGGLTQRPVVFVGDVAGEWQQVALPVPDLPVVAGQLSRATSVACPAGPGTCWVGGWVRGHALAWPLDVPASGAPSVAQPAVLPGDPPSGNDPATLVVLAGAIPVVFTNATTPSVQRGCPTGWQGLAAPPGRVTAAAAAPDGLYAVAGDALWRLAAPAC